MGIYKREYTKGRKPIWYYQFRHEKQKYAQAGFATEKEAKDAEQKKWNELNSKTQKPIANDRVSLNQFIPKFLEHRAVIKAQETVVREARRCKPLMDFFGEKRISQITSGEIHAYVAKRKTGDSLKNRSINLELTLLRSIFNFAIQSGFANANPAQEVTNLREVHDKRWTTVAPEFLRFVEAARTTGSGVVMVPWLFFRAFTGTRPKECYFVEWEDIDFENEQIFIRPKKGNDLKNRRFRVVEMHPQLKIILLEWRKKWNEIFEKRQRRHPEEHGTPHQWVFFNPHDQVAQAKSFSKCFRQARELAGIPKMTSYALRHFFVSQCLMSDIQKDTIAAFVGHKGTRMIDDYYGVLSTPFRRQQIRKLVLPDLLGANGAAGTSGATEQPEQPKATEQSKPQQPPDHSDTPTYDI